MGCSEDAISEVQEVKSIKKNKEENKVEVEECAMIRNRSIPADEPPVCWRDKAEGQMPIPVRLYDLSSSPDRKVPDLSARSSRIPSPAGGACTRIKYP